MGRPKKINEEVQEVQVPEVKPEAPNARVDTERVNVFDKSGKFVRDYVSSQSRPDKSFDEIAKEYAKKIGGTFQYPILTW